MKYNGKKIQNVFNKIALACLGMTCYAGIGGAQSGTPWIALFLVWVFIALMIFLLGYLLRRLPIIVRRIKKKKALLNAKIEEKKLSIKATNINTSTFSPQILSQPTSNTEDIDVKQTEDTSSTEQLIKVSTSGMLYCRYCGKQIPADSAYCPYCGKGQTGYAHLKSERLPNIVPFIIRIFESLWSLIKKILHFVFYPFIYLLSKKEVIIKGIKFIFRVLLILLAVCVVVSIFVVLYGVYVENTYNKEDEKRIELALNDISKADSIAMLLFEEDGKHTHEFITEEFIHLHKTDHIAEGINILRNAAEKGEVDAQFHLGCIYGGAAYNKEPFVKKDRQMTSEPIDNDKYAYWMRKAAHNGHINAMCHLGVCYLFGIGTTRHNANALYWIRKTAEKGNEFAQYNLGNLYETGLNAKCGSHLVECYRGESISGEYVNSYWNQNNELIDVYRVNDYKVLLPKDINKAKIWWEKAAKQGHKKAKEKLEKIW